MLFFSVPIFPSSPSITYLYPRRRHQSLHLSDQHYPEFYHSVPIVFRTPAHPSIGFFALLEPAYTDLALRSHSPPFPTHTALTVCVEETPLSEWNYGLDCKWTVKIFNSIIRVVLSDRLSNRQILVLPYQLKTRCSYMPLQYSWKWNNFDVLCFSDILLKLTVLRFCLLLLIL